VPRPSLTYEEIKARQLER